MKYIILIILLLTGCSQSDMCEMDNSRRAFFGQAQRNCANEKLKDYLYCRTQYDSCLLDVTNEKERNKCVFFYKQCESWRK